MGLAAAIAHRLDITACTEGRSCTGDEQCAYPVVFAPLAAMLAVALSQPEAVAPVFSGVFMEKLVGFLKLYFPVFLLGAIFGKLVERAGFARSLVAATSTLLGPRRAMLAIVLVCGLLTYGGVSLFVVAFAVYPFA
ncbi:MAG: hypothetical protein ACO26U_10255, partial [Burkholderiaceae bacterium]